MSVNQTIVDYLEVLLSAPVVSLICFLIAVLLFKKEISSLLNRLKSLKIFGNEANLDTQTSTEARNETTPADEVDKLKRQIDKVKKEKKSQKNEISERDGLINDLLRQVETMENRYLNLYFVRKTKVLLSEIVQQGQMDMKTALNRLSELGAPQSEASIIINLLLKYELIKQNVNIFHPTDKGKRVQAYIATHSNDAKKS